MRVDGNQIIVCWLKNVFKSFMQATCKRQIKVDTCAIDKAKQYLDLYIDHLTPS